MSLLDEAENAAPQNCIRILVLGTAQVGKTSLVRRFLTGKFEETYTPTIEDFHRKVYRIRGDYYKLDILDMSGIWINPAMRRLNILAGDVFVLVYSIENRQSFEEAKRLKDEIQTTIHTNAQSVSKWKHCKMVPIFVVGNKVDLNDRRAVENQEARHIFENPKLSVSCAEVSCREGWKTDELFMQVFELARLPHEMAPTLHRKVHYSYVYDRHDHHEVSGDEESGNVESTASANGRPSNNPSMTRRVNNLSRRRTTDAYGAYIPNAIRPSIQHDLASLQAVDNSEKFNRRSRRSVRRFKRDNSNNTTSSQTTKKEKQTCLLM